MGLQVKLDMFVDIRLFMLQITSCFCGRMQIPKSSRAKRWATSSLILYIGPTIYLL